MQNLSYVRELVDKFEYSEAHREAQVSPATVKNWLKSESVPCGRI